MGKINVPNNVELTKNAVKNIEIIEKNGNYDLLVNKINDFFAFVSTTPTDLFGARNKGWTIEKLNSRKNVSNFSIRIDKGNRFTYSVKDGNVTVLGILGHYVGTNLSHTIFNFEEIEELVVDFFYDVISYDEMIEKANQLGIDTIVPEFDSDNKDIILFDFVINNEHYYLNKEDLPMMNEYSKNNISSSKRR